MTRKEMFATIATINADNEEIVEFCNHEIEKLEARKSAPKGLTPTQKANVALKEAIMTALASMEEPVTVSELMEVEELKGNSNQKLSALLRQLGLEGKVTKVIEGKKSRFALA